MTRSTVTAKIKQQIENEIGHSIMDDVATLGNHLFFTTVGGSQWWCKLTDTGKVKKHSCRIDICD